MFMTVAPSLQVAPVDAHGWKNFHMSCQSLMHYDYFLIRKSSVCGKWNFHVRNCYTTVAAMC